MSGDMSRDSHGLEDPSPMQLPVLVVRDRVLFPGGLLRLSVGKPRSVRLVESLLTSKRDDHHAGGGPSVLLGIFMERVDNASSDATPNADVAVNEQQKEGAEARSRSLKSMSRVGCAAKVVQMSRVTGSENFKYSVLVQGVCRIRVLHLSVEGQMLHGMVIRLHETGNVADAEVKALSLNLREAAQALLEVLKSRSHPRALNAREILDAISAASPGVVADVLTSSLNISADQKQAVLEETSLELRLRRVLELVREQTHVLSIASKIHSEVEGKLNSRHREYYLRQQLKAIRSELGEEGAAGDGDEMSALEAKLTAAALPPEASKTAMRDLDRLKRMQPSQPEYTVVRMYLETISELPWNNMSQETYDIRQAQRQLDKDHYGLDKVKQRIVEYIAVRSLVADNKGSILCLVGPPGVGKTSLGRSIAAALQRKFQRLSLGGVHDEAEIRGHRRTYIGAMPGGIMRCLRRAGTRNPVLLLDEVDKIGSNIRGGDPAAALLEVLDSEQNDTFTDHYVNVPFNLSSVLFVATANKLDTIPEPLLDRLEVIHLPGYTLEEKVRIAEAYLIPKQMAKNGVTSEHILLPRSTVLRVASSYTREAGVRQLEREVAALCRHVALQVGSWQQDMEATQQEPPQHSATNTNNDEINLTPRISHDATAEQPPSTSHNGGAETPGYRCEDAAHGAPNEDQTGGSDDHHDSRKNAASTSLRNQGQQQQHQQNQNQNQNQQRPRDGPRFPRVVVTCEMLRGVLGPEVYESEVAARVALPGTATGLAWTSTGGELLFIECTAMPGSGAVKLTGKLGEVMQESAQIALSWIRSHEHGVCAQLGLMSDHARGTAADAAASSDVRRGREMAGGVTGAAAGGLLFPAGFFSDMDLHLHVPAGGVSKDGPSAGVAIASALLSLVSGRAIDPAVAMTGEITLRGLVLPVGGIRDKVLAARRGGIQTVILPSRNRGDLDDLPQEAADGMNFTFVDTIDDVIFALFPPMAAAAATAAGEDRDAPADEAGGTSAGGGAGRGGRPSSGGFQHHHPGHACPRDVVGVLLESFL